MQCYFYSTIFKVSHTQYRKKDGNLATDCAVGARRTRNKQIFETVIKLAESSKHISKAPVILYQTTFRSGLIFTPMGKIAVFTLSRCAPCHPAFFSITISNASKFKGEILRSSTLAPEVLAYCTGAYRIC